MCSRLLLTFLFVSLVTSGWTQEAFESDRAARKFIRKHVKAAKKHSEVFSEMLPPAHCQAELRILKHSLEEAQTTLYRYASKATVDSAFQAAFEHCTDSISYIDYVRNITRIQNIIACGHSGWNHSKAYRDYRNSNVGIFPLKIAVEGANYVVAENNSRNPEYPAPGDIIHRINGQSIPEILSEIRKHYVRDGASNDQWPMGIIDYFPMAYSNFIGTPETFSVTYEYPASGLTSTIDIQPRSPEALRYFEPHVSISTTPPPLRLTEFPEERAALYSIRTFRNAEITGYKQSFEHFTDSVFATLEATGVAYLYIDLRGNTGGWTANGNYLMSYLIDQEVPYLKVETNQTGDFSFEKLLKRYPGYPDTSAFTLQENGLYEWHNYPSRVVTPQDRHRFSGTVIILTDNMSRSCSGVFSSLMKEHTDAIFMGEETGTARCGSGGIVAAIELPYSGVAVYFSTAQYTCGILDTSDRHGVIPDILVRNAGEKDFSFFLEHFKSSPYY